MKTLPPPSNRKEILVRDEHLNYQGEKCQGHIAHPWWHSAKLNNFLVSRNTLGKKRQINGRVEGRTSVIIKQISLSTNKFSWKTQTEQPPSRTQLGMIPKPCRGQFYTHTEKRRYFKCPWTGSGAYDLLPLPGITVLWWCLHHGHCRWMSVLFP